MVTRNPPPVYRRDMSQRYTPSSTGAWAVLRLWLPLVLGILVIAVGAVLFS
jgi:hypothetical protein